MDWNAIWNSIVDFFSNNVWTIVLAIVTFLVGYIVIKILVKLFKVWFKRTKITATVQSFLLSIIKVLLFVLLILIVLQVLGVPITGLTAVLATAGVAISLALKDSLSNVAYGMILITTKPFEQGDYVMLGNVEGTVKKIDIMSSQIVTVDDKLITIPNMIIYSDAMINYSAQGKRRIDIFIQVAYNTDLPKAQKIAYDVCHSNPNILLDPAPQLHIREFDDSNLKLFFSCWATGPYWDNYHYIMDNLYNEFKRNGIRIDYPQVEVRMRDDEVQLPVIKKPLPKRIEKPKTIKEEFNLFDIETYGNLQQKIKTQKLNRLKAKKAKLDKELASIQATMPGAKIKALIANRSIMLKQKKPVTKITKKLVFLMPKLDKKQTKKKK